jgi:hypothetical protein
VYKYKSFTATNYHLHQKIKIINTNRLPQQIIIFIKKSKSFTKIKMNPQQNNASETAQTQQTNASEAMQTQQINASESVQTQPKISDAPETTVVSETTETSLGKRQYTLDENFYESSFNWNEDPSKKIKLDTQDARNNALNTRPSFTNLVSSASLILPPEMDTVVITRDQFVVEWSKEPNEEEMLPPTQVRQILSEERKSLVQDEIHRTSFRMPLYFCNASTSKDVITKVKEENRLSVMSQITDTETSLSNRLNGISAGKRDQIIKKLFF